MNEISAIRRIFGQDPVNINRSPVTNENGITNRIASAKAGIFRYNVMFSDKSVRFIGKRKSANIIANGMIILSRNDPLLFLLLLSNHKILGYNGSSVRESVFYNNIAPALEQYVPNIIGSAVGRFSGECFVAMEELPSKELSESNLYRAIDTIAAFHGRYYGDDISAKKIGLNCYSPKDYKKTRRCLKRMFADLSSDNLTFFGAEKTAVINDFIDNIHTEFGVVANRRTLTHNDYCNRNIYADDKRICIYDWELACYQNPEHDIIELLISLMTDMSDSDVTAALTYYKDKLSRLTGIAFSDKEYAMALRFNTLEFCVNKLSILRLAGRRLKLSYIDKQVQNASRMMDILNIYKNKKREKNESGIRNTRTCRL